MVHSGPNPVTLGHLMTFSGAKRQDQEYLGPQKDSICSYNGPLGTPRGAPKVRKWVSDAHPVNIGQLDHYVVFGTKSGAVQEFWRGYKCPIGVKQPPLDPPRLPKTPPNSLKTPPNPIIDPPYKQYNSSSYLLTH